MMLAPTLSGSAAPLKAATRSPSRRGTLDAAILTIVLLVPAGLFFQGGLEALAGAGLGALLGARSSDGMVSGAFAGLFTGALFAAFFHQALASVVGALF